MPVTTLYTFLPFVFTLKNIIHLFLLPRHAGRDCSASAAEVVVKQAARQSLCAGLVDLVLLSDPSPHLLDSLAAMLGSIFDAGSGEITSDAAKIQCAHVLKIIGVLAGQGFLQVKPTAYCIRLAETYSYLHLLYFGRDLCPRRKPCWPKSLQTLSPPAAAPVAP